MSIKMPRRLRVGLSIVGLLVAGATLVAWLNFRDEEAITPEDAVTAVTPETIARGAYLARAGNCIGCHTVRGSAEYAGGRGIETPFGTVYAPNLTPDRETGIGAWTASEFWRAMHNGRSRDGRLLYPAFPYPNFTLVTREDSDALYAFLQSLPAVRQPNRPHELRFPYNLQASLALWRALYFRPTGFAADTGQSVQWNRGSYLVRGLGHCVACHSSRNWLGATAGDIELGGGLIPMQNWYAPSLAKAHEAGVADWSEHDIVALLGSGISARGSVMGPMAEVVYRSTQHLTEQDLRAMAAYLKTLPKGEAKQDQVKPAGADIMRVGEKIYADRCASCHGESGEGSANIYPPLVANRAVTMASPINFIKAILHGGFPPATRGNPRPFGMPPFKQVLSEGEVAAVATYVRQSWGNQAEAVSELDVHRAR
jgi:mono/diheme cytochrome c family protein